MNKHSKILGTAFATLVAVMGMTTDARADAISSDCGHHDTIGIVPSPPNSHVLDILDSDTGNIDVRLALSFPGEPVSGGAWLLLFNYTGEIDPECYLVHSGNDAEERGFYYVYVEKLIYTVNSDTGFYEVFVPVSEYPFAGEKVDRRIRMIEINFDDDGAPYLVQ